MLFMEGNAEEQGQNGSNSWEKANAGPIPSIGLQASRAGFSVYAYHALPCAGLHLQVL